MTGIRRQATPLHPEIWLLYTGSSRRCQGQSKLSTARSGGVRSSIGTYVSSRPTAPGVIGRVTAGPRFKWLIPIEISLKRACEPASAGRQGRAAKRLRLHCYDGSMSSPGNPAGQSARSAWSCRSPPRTCGSSERSRRAWTAGRARSPVRIGRTVTSLIPGILQYPARKFIPAAPSAIGQMKKTLVSPLDEQFYARGKVPGVGGRADLIVHDIQGLEFGALLQNGLHKILAAPP